MLNVKRRKVISALGLSIIMLAVATCGGEGQIADTQTPEAKVVAKAIVQPTPTQEPPKSAPTNIPVPEPSPTEARPTATAKAVEVAPATTPTPSDTPTPTATATPVPPPTATPTPLPTATHTPTPVPPTSVPPTQKSEIVLEIKESSASELLTLIKTIAVTPDENFEMPAAFCRINYVPVTDKFLVTFGGTAHGFQGYGYKWYTPDLEFTGEFGMFEDRGTDTASVMIDSTYYFLTDGGKDVWTLKKFDPLTWTLLGETSMQRDSDKEPGNDFMLAYVNGMLDASGLYIADAQGALNQKNMDPRKGEATSHRFFTTDLEFLETRVLSDTPHINATSMVYVDGIYSMVTSTAFFGDLIVMRYDNDWNYLDSKFLSQWGNWPMGMLYDSGHERFYVTYNSVANVVNKQGLRYVRLAIFDSDWNLIDDIVVTPYDKDAMIQSGRPWVIVKNDRVYVSYDISTMDPETMKENKDWQCAVSEYEITP